MKKNLCLFASYSLESRVESYVYILLRAIKTQLNCDIYFSTTSDDYKIEDKLIIDEICLNSEKIDNNYDFGSYINGLKNVSNWKDYDNIYFINDSVYGPTSDFSEVATKMEASSCDVWGLTEGYSIAYHLQSYFLCFKPKSYNLLEDFISAYSFPRNYWDVVHQGEVGLSQHMIKNGMRLLSLVSKNEMNAIIYKKHKDTVESLPPKVKKKLAESLNKSNILFSFWEECLIHFKLPIIKVKLIKDHQFYSFHFGSWVKYCNNELFQAIENHIHSNFNGNFEGKEPLNVIIAYSNLFRYMINPTITKREVTKALTIEEQIKALEKKVNKKTYLRPEDNIFRG